MTDQSNAFTGAGRKAVLANSTVLKLRQKSPRAQRLAAKAAQRHHLPKRSTPFSFARLAEDPLYRRIAKAWCPEDLSEAMSRFGFETAADVAACRTPSMVMARLGRTVDRDFANQRTMRKLLSRSKREALRIYRLMHHAVAVNDPMNQGLRHTPSVFSVPVPADPVPDTEIVQAYANPSSLQSNQSLAAYLRYLYRIATGLDQEIGILCPEDSPYALVNRRPDLADLVLNQANLKKEVPTIQLVNEVLSAGLSDIDMRKSFHPIALPYDHSATTARAALAQIGRTEINDIATRTSNLGFETFRDHRWAIDQAGLLGLLGLLGTSDSASSDGSVLSLLTEDWSEPSSAPFTLDELYNTQARDTASQIDHMMSSLDLDFDALTQLFGFYAVSQESGAAVTQKDFATAFLANQAPFELRVADGLKSVQMAEEALTAPDLRSLHYLARLHHATGLAFHDLNTILALPGAAADVAGAPDDPRRPSRRLTSAGLRLLASYPLYRDAYGLTPAAYAALFGEISPYWRADQVIESEATVAGIEQTEMSFLATLFQEDAPFVHKVVSAGTTSIQDETLASIIARGLGLSSLELEKLVSVLDAAFALTNGVDARALGALYRLTTLCRVLGWSLLSGLDLIERASAALGDDNGLWTALITRNVTEAETVAICSALDWLVSLSQWMVEAEIAPQLLIALLTPSEPGVTQTEEEDVAWLEGISSAFRSLAVLPETFRGFETWQGDGTSAVDIAAVTWQEHLSRTNPIYRPSGVFLADLDGETIEDSCRACLIAAGIDPEQDANRTQLNALVARLDGLRATQIQMIETQVAALDAKVSAVSAAPLILWAQTRALDLLEMLLRGPDDQDSLSWLSEIKRHIAIVAALDLGDVDLWLLGYRPHWLAPAVASGPFQVKPLDLEQVYWLQRFATVQVGAATDAAWRGYLALTHEGRPEAGVSEDELDQWIAGCRETSALLLGCPIEDIGVYLDALFGAGSVAQDVAQIDTLARHVRLAENLNISARDLLALKEVSNSEVSGDWTAAAAAAQAGLSRFDKGRQMPGFRKLLAERERDALIAAFMQTNIAKDEALRGAITDRETLYTYLLLDVNVTSAVPTSRLVEATSSLQLYISRALAGLEPGASFVDRYGYDRRDALVAQWELDKDYRQWEANQKLRLYPQNYIEPELRVIRSPEFDALQQAVSGGDVSPDSVEAAVNAYMNGLAGACDLSMCSFYAERHKDGEGIENVTYHVLAKAKWEPGRFFYRKVDADYQTIADLAELTDPSQYLKAMDWTYWQEVSIPKTFDLFSDVTVCVFKNRYYFFWLELEERRDQTPDGPKPVWRLHPRYMRCDQNALVGPMLKPGLFFQGTIDSTVDALTIDGAFQWSGAKPVPNGTYHPTRAPDGLIYGQLNGSDTRDAIAKETFTVAFGIDLPGAPGDAENAARQVSPQKTSLHIRLSEDWSDAIMDLGGGLLTFFEDYAPQGYGSVHPKPVTETRGIVDQYNISSTHGSLADIHGRYTSRSRDVFNLYQQDSANSRITFVPAAKGNPNLGSVEIEMDLGQRLYTILGSTVEPVLDFNELGHTLVSTRFDLEFDTDDGRGPLHMMTDWERRATGQFGINQAYITSNTTIKRDTNERFTATAVLPEGWTLDDLAEAKLTVRAEVKREFPDIELSIIALSNASVLTVTIPPDERARQMKIDLGTFVLRPPVGKDNSAWVQAGEHGSRNFMHLTDKENRQIKETFILLNSSSVLSKLAKTMPRPGGCESLFSLENQEGIEDLGIFLDTFPQTLKELYEGDQTQLDPVRLPDAAFDFDSAYGAYGWEVFYHIPSAIAGGYASSGQFDQALAWLKKIFDPQLEIPWRVKPMLNATEPQDGLAFDTGGVIVDPDRIAQDYPFYYQQATIRNYLEVLLDAGDAAYEQQTQESLQRAKALYVSAKQHFSDSLSDTLESLTNTPWTDPALGAAAVDGYDGFLPPYNDELRKIYATLEARLFNLRNWLDLHGDPLDVPLLTQPIDPRELQRSAKAKLTLRGASAENEDETDTPLGFTYVVKSAKGYLNNLKLTSHRLQDANEKESDSQMEEFRMDAAIRKSNRAVGLQDFAIAAAEKDVAIKEANVSASTIALANHLAQILAKTVFASKDTSKAAVARIRASSVTISNVMTQVSGSVKSTIPNTFGFSNGGQNLEQSESISASLKVSRFLFQWDAGEKADKAKLGWDKVAELTLKTGELSSALGAASLELQKAKITLEKEEATRAELELQNGGAQALRDEWDEVFGGTSFYKPFREDLETLYAEEWAATQEFSRLLVRLYEDETQQVNGATFLRTTSLGSGVEKFNAPHRLALDIERLETAYIQAVLDQASETSEVQFALSELPALGQCHSALDELVTQGEAYFDLTNEMFDVLYPGQFDRRIQSISVSFPGLAEAGLSPHGRLTQIANTRYMTPERDLSRAAKTRKNRHGLQSLALSACEVDSRSIEAPDGLLQRFQNTGVDSRWHLVLPTVQELKRSKTGRGRDCNWRDAAAKRYEALKPHLNEVDFNVRFSGRWIS